ncbi:hypothetical protein [Donghicola sp. XS_ASV15]|uniref:hypothetical protein n=1 Tax=Donghicola sp. XS_ASV15 TaxID=3241295 RepID=UPI00351726FD
MADQTKQRSVSLCKAVGLCALLTMPSLGFAAQSAVPLLPEILISADDLQASETGDPAVIRLSLSQQPDAVVTLNLQGDKECRVSPNKLTYRSSNWDLAQTLSVLAIPDAAAEGLHRCQPRISIETEDRTYKAIAATLPSVAIKDAPVDAVSERLETILRKDFSSTLVQQQAIISGIMTDATRRLTRGYYGLKCGVVEPFDISGHVEIKKTSRAVRGTFGEETVACHGARRQIGSGRFALSESDTLGRQSLLSYTHMVETHSPRALKGRFVGGYGSEAAVEKLAMGTISGAGTHAGLYGVQRFRKILLLSYFASAVLGHHSYDLQFPDSGGAIDASGTYDYAAALAGIGLSGQRSAGPFVLHPKADLRLTYGEASTSRVRATQGPTQSFGNLDMPAYQGLRSGLELGFEFDHPSLASVGWDRAIWVAPRLGCLSDVVQGDLNCDSGLKMQFDAAHTVSQTRYSLGLDAQADRTSRWRGVTVSRTVALDSAGGHVRTSLGMNDRSKPTYEYAFSFEF